MGSFGRFRKHTKCCLQDLSVLWIGQRGYEKSANERNQHLSLDLDSIDQPNTQRLPPLFLSTSRLGDSPSSTVRRLRELPKPGR